MSSEQPPVRVFDAWKMQLGAYHFAMNNPGVMLPLLMGRGKSKAAVDVVINRDDRRVLIVCPKTVLGVWRREFARHGCEDHIMVILDKGTVKKRSEQLNQALSRPPSGKRLIVVINYDAYWREPIANMIMMGRWDNVILDESHRIKSATGKASRFAGRLARLVPHRTCLTGTPLPHSPLDAFGQYRFLDPSVFGTSYTLFRSTFAICDKMFPSKVLSWINQDEFSKKFYSIAYHPLPEDDIDLPSVRHEMRTCELPPGARRIYDDMETDFIAQVRTGVTTAANALVKLLRLQQISSGHTKTEDDKIVDIHDEKSEVLLDLLKDLPKDEPFIVFCRFRRDLDAVKKVAEKLNKRYGEISGRRKDVTEMAEMPDDIDLMAVQMQSGGVGINLSRACYAAYYSIGFSLGDFDQTAARLHRAEQTRPVIFYHILANKTIDHAVYGALKKRRQVIEAVLDVFQEPEAVPF